MYGSFPYHRHSSICLSALHGGLVEDARGGGVWFDVFLSQTWDEAAIELYPHGAERGSSSMGLTSQPVSVLTPEPLTLQSFSCTLMSRGTVFTQRRTAPWSARSGHVHVSSDDFVAGWSAGVTFPFFAFHLIVGGRNATAYMNDVWLYVHPITLGDGVTNGRWLRLPDAPFSPRAHMAATFQSSLSSQGVVFLGGEVATACGLEQLPVCTNDVWTMRFAQNASEEVGFSFWWEPNAGRLPFSPRCGALLMSDPIDVYNQRTGFLVALMGGQLSYTDPTCQTPPASLNEIFYSTSNTQYTNWYQPTHKNAPWSPRQSMVAMPGTTPSDFALMGGVTYQTHRFDSATNRSTLTAAVLHADVWLCSVFHNATEPPQCDWTAQYRSHDVEDSVPALRADLWGMAGSLPVPIAGSQVSLIRAYNDGFEGLHFGGLSSQQALDDWSRANASVSEEGGVFSVPVTSVTQPYPARLSDGGDLVPPPSEADVIASRYGLPVSYQLLEAELNSPTSPFILGAPGLVMTFTPYERGAQVARRDQPAPAGVAAFRRALRLLRLQPLAVRQHESRGAGLCVHTVGSRRGGDEVSPGRHLHHVTPHRRAARVERWQVGLAVLQRLADHRADVVSME